MNRETDIRPLTGRLDDEDAIEREQSRNKLIQPSGHDVTHVLVTALIDPSTHETGNLWRIGSKSFRLTRNNVTAGMKRRSQQHSRKEHDHE